jgi:hypothetical protein
VDAVIWGYAFRFARAGTGGRAPFGVGVVMACHGGTRASTVPFHRHADCSCARDDNVEALVLR